MDKLSYAWGLAMGRQLQGMGMNELNVEDFKDGVKSVFDGTDPAVSPEEALARACADSHRVASRINLSPVLAHTAISDEGRNAVYVFNNPGRSGYMLLAADDVAYPLLAYADSGSFDPDSIPESMQWWLD